MKKMLPIGMIALLAASMFIGFTVQESRVADAYTLHAPIHIDGNANFTTANGVTGGSGIPSDPYIIEGWEINASTAHGIEIRSTDAHFVIRDVYVHSGGYNYHGLYFIRVANGIVENSNLSDNSFSITLGQSYNFTIINNIISSSMYGIRLSDSYNNTVVNNRASNNLYGITLRNSFNNIIENNTIESSDKINIDLMFSYSNIVVNNTVNSSKDYGLFIDFSHNNTVTNNTFTNSQSGIFTYYSENNTLVDNNVSHNIDGIYMFFSYSNVLVNNTLKNNGILIGGIQPAQWNTHDIDTSNTVNGKPVYYWKNRNGGVVPSGAGEVILANSTNILVENQDVSNGTVGILLGFSNNNTLANNTANSNNRIGASLSTSHGNILLNNTLNLQDSTGMSLSLSNNNTIKNNTLNSNPKCGIYLYSSGNNTLANNTMVSDGITIWGDALWNWNTHDIDTSNTVNGKPVYYWKDRNGGVVPSGAGEVILANSTNIIVQDQNVSDGSGGIQLGFSKNNTLVNNNASNNGGNGIYLYFSNGTILEYNSINLNSENGIYISTSHNLTLENNTVISNKLKGIFLYESNNSYLVNNTVSNNDIGIQLHFSNATIVYHNNLMWNNLQASDNRIIVNSWDNGYPIGGNFWSDYMGIDNCSGPNQDVCPDPDGIGDTPYNFDAYTRDRYPLMKPSYLDEFPPIVTIASPTNGQMFTSSPIAVNGTASDLGSGLDRVEVRVNSGVWQTATGTLTWDISVDVTLGTNLIEAQAWDNRGNPSDIVSVNVTYTPLATPGSPTNLTAVAGNGQVNLTWDPPTDDGGSPITNYTVYRGTTSGGETFLVEIGNVTAYLDTGLTNGQTYYYIVTARNVVGHGPNSTEAFATPATTPSAPLNLTVVFDSGEVILIWEPPASDGGMQITNYRVYRGLSPGGETLLIELGNVLTYTDPGTVDGVTYYYRVSAVNAIGEGELSEEKSFTHPPAVDGAIFLRYLLIAIAVPIIFLIVAMILMLRRRKREPEESVEELPEKE